MVNFTSGTRALAAPLDGDKRKIVFIEQISIYMCSDVENVTIWHKQLKISVQFVKKKWHKNVRAKFQHIGVYEASSILHGFFPVWVWLG